MRITAKADYAVRAALELAAAPDGCRDDVWTSVIAIDPTMQRWLVVDDSQSKHTGALRLLGLTDGSSRTIASAHDIGTTMTAPTYSTSPSSARMCGWSIVHVPTQTSTLFCASLADGVPENIATFDGEGPSFDWLGDERIVVQRGGGWVIVDLVRRTYTRVLGAPFDASKASLRTLGATGKRFVAGSAVIDLESRSYTTFSVPAASISVEWNPGNDRRFAIIERGTNVTKNRAFWVDL